MLDADDVLRKPGRVGLPSPGVEVRLNPDGEVAVRSELLMDGYFDQPDATTDVLRDGWYQTGDLGVLDDEGYLSIVGRARDVIRTGGETVAPPEVEAVLAQCPGVADVAVIGLPDAETGERCCAVVQCKEAAAPLELAEIAAFLKDRGLMVQKIPEQLERIDLVPRNATGKILKHELRERYRGAPFARAGH
jgi:acyl-CoA synthetase (AMP-forming)/AMP-acid ligase II